MGARRPDMVLNEAPRQTDAHHPQSQEDKGGFSHKSVVVDLECLKRFDLRKLLNGSDLTSARWKRTDAAEIRQFLFRQALHVRYHFVGYAVLKHPLVRHMGCHIRG